MSDSLPIDPLQQFVKELRELGWGGYLRLSCVHKAGYLHWSVCFDDEMKQVFIREAWCDVVDIVKTKAAAAARGFEPIRGC